MSHYKPYPAYRNSGVEWIGFVPEHWLVSAVKREFDTQLGKMLQPEQKSPSDITVPYHKAVSVQWENVADTPPERMWASPAEVEQFRVRKGDLLICEGGDVGRAAVFEGDDADPVIIQNSIHRVRAKNGNNNELLLRVMQTVKRSGWFDVLCSKATIVHFTSEKLGDLAYPVAPQEESKAIVSAIKRETTRIDALITKKTRFIELLREKRQALITHAVTKGLDPDVKMKDSGVEWIGEVPEHWVAIKFNHVARVTEGLVDPKDYPYRDMVLIAPNHIESGTGKILGLETAVAQNAESGKYTCKKGAVIYSKIRPALAKVAIAPCDCLCSADMYPMYCTNLSYPEWLFYLMLSPPFTSWAILESDRVAMPKINRESLADLRVFLPPMEEQVAAVEWLKIQLQKLEKVSLATQRSIDLLKERRAAFITAAVTGQIDLRESA